MSTFRTNSDLIELSLPKQGYAAFDAAGLKSLIVERLNDNNVFTDQNFEGSNINSFIDIISYAYHVLLFYLNNTSNESMFSEAQIYENINRIVKSLDYKPVGTLAPTLTISSIATANLLQGTYTIPRYSSITTSGVTYCFSSDITFVKKLTVDENLDTITGKTLLYQGTYKEYPEYTSTGEPNEILSLVPSENEIVDHFNIDVYVSEGGVGGEIYQYGKSSSLYFERPTSRSFEIRLNENKRYEIKFGNGINARQLTEGDIVYVYYLVTDGTGGELEAGAASNRSIALYNSNQLTNILSSTKVRGDGVVYTSQSDCDQVLISNTDPSTKFYTGESVEDIRKNAPNTFSSQHRLVSITDYEAFIMSNFSNFVTDVKGVDNNTYLDTHIKYYYDLGMTSPSLESRVLLNQVQFSTSCNFNNLYLYCIPRLEKTTSETIRANYLTTAQKELIVERLSDTKTITCDPIVMDPVYVAVNIGARGQNETLSVDQTSKSRMMIVQDDNSRVNSNDIIQRVVEFFKTYFNPVNAKIGMTIDLTALSNQLLSINGVNTFYIYRPDLPGTYVEGLSLYIWNPVYPADLTQTTQNFSLPIFKFPFFENVDKLGDSIVVARQSDAVSMLNSTTSQNNNLNISSIVTTDTESTSTGQSTY